MNRRRVALGALCREHSVAILYSFGSRAKEVLAWLNDPEAILAPGPSDVDLGIKPLPATEFNWKTEVALEQALQDLLGVERIDLVNLDNVNPFLAAEVVHGERLYAKSEYAADNFDLYILRQEGDLAFLEDERARLLLGIPK
ncbi:MAG: nucleotidyltransferase domain-containing protein [Caldilineaceae bacterium]|nr:nucleotidyltransferase domain-containing protein [Caldilineaceae bacterium]